MVVSSWYWNWSLLPFPAWRQIYPRACRKVCTHTRSDLTRTSWGSRPTGSCQTWRDLRPSTVRHFEGSRVTRTASGRSPSQKWGHPWSARPRLITRQSFGACTPADLSCSTKVILVLSILLDFIQTKNWFWPRVGTRQHTSGNVQFTFSTKARQDQVWPRRKCSPYEKSNISC